VRCALFTTAQEYQLHTSWLQTRPHTPHCHSQVRRGAPAIALGIEKRKWPIDLLLGDGHEVHGGAAGGEREGRRLQDWGRRRRCREGGKRERDARHSRRRRSRSPEPSARRRHGWKVERNLSWALWWVWERTWLGQWERTEE
jgi:hypothetical protein